jgi:hypothetical protein
VHGAVRNSINNSVSTSKASTNTVTSHHNRINRHCQRTQ